MIDLTEEQKDAILELGSTESIAKVMSTEIIQQLIDLNLVFTRASDRCLDLTDLGESVYDELTRQ